MGSGRRLSNTKFSFLQNMFEDETEESELMRGHLFYLGLVIVLTLFIHKVVYVIYDFNGAEVPAMARAPKIEIQVFFVLLMGMLDVSAQVLFNSDTATGWKAVAALELVLVAFFFSFLVMKGREFRRLVHWEPAANVKRLRLKQSVASLDTNNDGIVTLEEQMAGAAHVGLTNRQASELFKKLDTKRRSSIDRSKMEIGVGEVEYVAAELATPVERLWAYVVEPRRPAGHYTFIDPDKRNSEDPWMNQFMSYTPVHVHFLALRIVLMVVESFVLGGMDGLAQGLFMVVFSFIVLVLILYSPPAVLLAQSRVDTVSALGHFLTYLVNCVMLRGWMSTDNASQTLTIVSGLTLLHAIATALEPLAVVACCSLCACLCCREKTKEAGDEEAVDEENRPSDDKKTKVTNLEALAWLDSTEDAVALVWQRLKAHAKSEGSFPVKFHNALKVTAFMTIKKHRANSFSASSVRERELSQDNNFDPALFHESLASMQLEGMTASIAKILLIQTTGRNGVLMSVEELTKVLNEPKYSSDGRLSRAARLVSSSDPLGVTTTQQSSGATTRQSSMISLTSGMTSFRSSLPSRRSSLTSLPSRRSSLTSPRSSLTSRQSSVASLRSGSSIRSIQEMGRPLDKVEVPIPKAKRTTSASLDNPPPSKDAIQKKRTSAVSSLFAEMV